MNKIMEAADQLIAEIRRLTAENAELRAKIDAREPEPAKFEMPKDRDALLRKIHETDKRAFDSAGGSLMPFDKTMACRESRVAYEAAVTFTVEFAKAFAMEVMADYGLADVGMFTKAVVKLAERYK